MSNRAFYISPVGNDSAAGTRENPFATLKAARDAARYWRRKDDDAETAEIINTFVYDRGLLSGDYSYSAAVGLFVNVINLVMLLIVNKASKKMTDTSLF